MKIESSHHTLNMLMEKPFDGEREPKERGRRRQHTFAHFAIRLIVHKRAWVSEYRNPQLCSSLKTPGLLVVLSVATALVGFSPVVRAASSTTPATNKASKTESATTTTAPTSTAPTAEAATATTTGASNTPQQEGYNDYGGGYNGYGGGYGGYGGNQFQKYDNNGNYGYGNGYGYGGGVP